MFKLIMFELLERAVSKHPDGQCLENVQSPRGIIMKMMLVGPRQLVLTIVLEKNEKPTW